jgi:hypothetical protein
MRLKCQLYYHMWSYPFQHERTHFHAARRPEFLPRGEALVFFWRAISLWRRVDPDERGPGRHGGSPWCRTPHVCLFGVPCHRASSSLSPERGVRLTPPCPCRQRDTSSVRQLGRMSTSPLLASSAASQHSFAGSTYARRGLALSGLLSTAKSTRQVHRYNELPQDGGGNVL